MSLTSQHIEPALCASSRQSRGVANKCEILSGVTAEVRGVRELTLDI